MEKADMRLIEQWVMALAIGAIPPVIGLMVGWWGTAAVLPERGVMITALCGFALGLVVDALFMRRAMARADAAPFWLWGAVYIFYSIGAFGFLMGVPVLVALLGLPAGLLLGGWLARQGATRDEVRQVARRASAFTTAVLAIACVASATIALLDRYTAANLEGMLDLPFEVTTGMIVALIVVGGAGLLAVHWVLTGAAVRWSHARLSRKG
jgi:hypothetical protein